MKKEDVKEVILQILELQLDSQLRAIRCLQGKPEAEPAFPRRPGRRRQSLVDLSVQILTETRKPKHRCQVLICDFVDSRSATGC